MSGRPPARLMAESGAAIILASAAIRLVRFRRLALLLSRTGRERGADPNEVAVIARALRAWSRRLPWRTLCFEQGLAAHWMLRRRGLQSTLYYGAATIDGEFKAHVWVRSGDLDVIGCEQASDYALLARFPERRGAPDVSASSPPL